MASGLLVLSELVCDVPDAHIVSKRAHAPPLGSVCVQPSHSPGVCEQRGDWVKERVFDLGRK
jgi:hypothetical protein